jgi:hypothetical protein
MRHVKLGDCAPDGRRRADETARSAGFLSRLNNRGSASAGTTLAPNQRCSKCQPAHRGTLTANQARSGTHGAYTPRRGIRKYTVRRGSAEELARRVREGFVPLDRQMPGFRSYYCWMVAQMDVGALGRSGVVGCSSFSGSDRPMPQKHNAGRRHHIPKMSFKVELAGLRGWPAPAGQPYVVD